MLKILHKAQKYLKTENVFATILQKCYVLIIFKQQVQNVQQAMCCEILHTPRASKNVTRKYCTSTWS